MKVNQTNLLHFLDKSGNLQVPVYHRSYRWTLRQCSQLWSDIIRLAENDLASNHFLGSVVYIEQETTNISSIATTYLVDGAQRLVTISLLIAAIGKILAEEDEFLAKNLVNKYLFNIDGLGNSSYKLELGYTDKETYNSVVNNDKLPINYSERVYENFEFFVNQIKDSSISPVRIIESLQSLMIIDIALQRDIDNPQLVLNSLNSTGLVLSQTEQIRNYILMGLTNGDQEEIYNNYWLPVERIFEENGIPDHFENFICDYLTIHNNGEKIDLADIYSNFDKFFRKKSQYQQIKDVIRHIYDYSRYYIKLVFADEQDLQIKRAVETINNLQITDAYPFLLEVYDDYENGLINRDIFLEILNTVQSYFLRNRIQENAESANSSMFASLSRDINKMLATKTVTIRDLEQNQKSRPKSYNKNFDSSRVQAYLKSLNLLPVTKSDSTPTVKVNPVPSNKINPMSQPKKTSVLVNKEYKYAGANQDSNDLALSNK